MTRTGMRRCGKRYRDEDEASRSKAARVPGAELTRCRCGGVHVVKPPKARSDGRQRKKVSGSTVPGRVCKQADDRDAKRCVHCGSARSLHRHHRRIKGHGGDTRPHTDCACNIVLLCTACHEWAHSGKGRREAVAEGLILPRAELEPWTKGVMVHSDADSGATRWPTCDGRYADEVEMAA